MARQYYKDSTTGQMKPIGVKVEDTLPVGTEVDYDGQTIPEGWTQVTTTPTEITPIAGTSYNYYGGCYYYQIGTRVHLHFGLGGLTANTDTVIYNLPSSIKPNRFLVAIGMANDLARLSTLTINTAGEVTVRSTGTYIAIDIDYDLI